MRDRGARAPFGSIADVSGGRGRRIPKLCAECGAGLPDLRKTYCGPCYAVRLQKNIAANRHKYRKRP